MTDAEWHTTSTVISSVGIFISATAIVVSAVVAGLVAKSNRDLTKQLHDVNRELTKQLHEATQRQHRRDQLIPVWREMLEISRIKSDKPDDEDVRKALNLLSLVAQCANLEIVEVAVLKEMFGRLYIDVYNDIAAINKDVKIGHTTKPGRDYLADSPLLKKWYDKWPSVA